MATKKVITPVKKIEARPKKEDKVLVEKKEKVIVEEAAVEGEEKTFKAKTKKVCPFCTAKTNPSYTDLATLKRFLTDRAKIVGKERTGVCSKHQRAVALNIKYARHLSLLPFVPKV